jgi:hypothetical protein
MSGPIILLLLVFWCYLAYGALMRGDTVRAGIYVLIGVALTWYRLGLRRRRRVPARPDTGAGA